MSATETMTTPAAETPAPVAEKATLPAFDYTFSGAYTLAKAAYALYVPLVVVTLVATYAAKLLSALPFKVAALESLETLDAFLVSFFGKADTKAVEIKGQAVTKYETVKGDVDVKVTEVKAKVETYKTQALELKSKTVETATAKVDEVKAKAMELKETATAKVTEVKETAEAKYDEVKVIAAKKVEQTKVVAQKVKVVAVETATALKTEIENEGLVVVATKAGEVVKEQSVAAYEVAKTEGVETLVKNVTTAVIEKVNEVPLAETAEVEVEKEAPAVVAACGEQSSDY